MSQPAVVAAVVALLGTVAEISSAATSRPETVPWGDGACALVYADAYSKLQQLTFGPNGVVQAEYTVHIDTLLGSENLPESEADALAMRLADRMRSVCYADRTLGGVCLKSTLDTAGDTLRTYRANLGAAQDRYADYPQVKWQLLIVEHVAASSAAQT